MRRRKSNYRSNIEKHEPPSVTRWNDGEIIDNLLENHATIADDLEARRRRAKHDEHPGTKPALVHPLYGAIDRRDSSWRPFEMALASLGNSWPSSSINRVEIAETRGRARDRSQTVWRWSTWSRLSLHVLVHTSAFFTVTSSMKINKHAPLKSSHAWIFTRSKEERFTRANRKERFDALSVFPRVENRRRLSSRRMLRWLGKIVEHVGRDPCTRRSIYPVAGHGKDWNGNGIVGVRLSVVRTWRTRWRGFLRAMAAARGARRGGQTRGRGEKVRRGGGDWEGPFILRCPIGSVVPFVAANACSRPMAAAHPAYCLALLLYLGLR